MKKTLTKLLTCILITLILTNFCMSNIAHANAIEAFANDAWGVVITALNNIFGTVVGIFAYPYKIIPLALALSTQNFMASIAYSQGTVEADGSIKNATIFDTDTWFLTPFDIIFNKVALIDVDIFNIPSTAGAIKDIREAAAGWYYVMRTIAAAILLCVLIYVGIRMALSTVASDKASYKKMLVDWVTSLALIFLLQYIIVFTFAVNSAFIKALKSVSRSNEITESIRKLYEAALLNIDIDSIAATVVICMLTWQTLSLLISYITRMLKVTFLIIISPLITLTYSIDKMGDGKAQALNLWLKEFVYTVLIQPFHCIIYVVFIGIAIEMLGRTWFDWDGNNIGTAVLCILCIHFTKEAEKILGKIFNFSDSTSGTSLATGMLATAALVSNAKNIGKGARNLVNNAKNMKGAINTARIDGMALATFLSKDNKNAERPISYAEAKEQATEKFNADNEAKQNKKAERLYNKHKASYTAEDKKKIQEVAKEMKKSNPGMTSQEALRQARIQASRKKMENGDYKPKAIRKARGVISAVSQTETGKLLKNTIIPSMVSMGAGTFVGAGSFGVGGNAIQSIMLGSATSKGIGEFFKTSTNRLTKENAELMAGAGVKTVAGAKDYMGQIAGREDELKDISKSLDDIYKQILDELDGLDEKEKKQVKGTIKNYVEQAMITDPKATNTDIINGLGKNEIIADAMKRSHKNINSFSGVLNKGISLQRDAKIFQNMQIPTNCGLNPGIVMDDTVQHFNSLLVTDGIPSETSNNGRNRPQTSEEQTPPNSNQSDGNTDGGNSQGNENAEENSSPTGNDIKLTSTSEETLKTISELPEDVQEEIRRAIEVKVEEYKKDILDGISHDDAYRKVVESQIQNLEEENARYVRKILEDENLIKKLATINEETGETIKRIQRMKG